MRKHESKSKTANQDAKKAQEDTAAKLEKVINASFAGKDAVPPPPTGRGDSGRRDYGIEDAIQLMRRLPEADLHILSAVIKECLESTNIRIANIIKDAEVKEVRLEERIKKLRGEIEDLEAMITSRRATIQALNEDLDETRQVKNNLSLAEGAYDLAIEAGGAERQQQDAAQLESAGTARNERAILLDSLFQDMEETKNQQVKETATASTSSS
jgi:DNA-binding transcriptional MerR regulator